MKLSRIILYYFVNYWLSERSFLVTCASRMPALRMLPSGLPGLPGPSVFVSILLFLGLIYSSDSPIEQSLTRFAGFSGG